MNCPNCNNLVDEKDEYCSYCGTKVKQDTEKFCQNCGNKILLSSEFCSQCGMSQKNAEDKKKTAIVDGMRNFISSNLALAIVIVTTITTILGLISSVISSGLLGSILNGIIYIFMLIGMWKTYLYGKNSYKYKENGMKLVSTSIKITKILTIIVTVLCGAVFLIGCSCTGCAVGLSEESGLVIMILVIFAITGIFLFGILGFIIFYLRKAERFAKSVGLALSDGSNDYQKDYKFIYVMQWIVVVISIIGAILSIILIASMDLINASLEELMKEMEDVYSEYGIEMTYQVSEGLGTFSIVSTILSLASPILYLIGIKKFDEQYRSLSK